MSTRQNLIDAARARAPEALEGVSSDDEQDLLDEVLADLIAIGANGSPLQLALEEGSEQALGPAVLARVLSGSPIEDDEQTSMLLEQCWAVACSAALGDPELEHALLAVAPHQGWPGPAIHLAVLRGDPSAALPNALRSGLKEADLLYHAGSVAGLGAEQAVNAAYSLRYVPDAMKYRFMARLEALDESLFEAVENRILEALGLMRL